MNKKQQERNQQRRPAWRIGQSNLEESYPQRILRRVLHEGNLERSGNMRRVAATRSGAADKLGWAGVAEIARELRRVERRRYAVNAMPGWGSPAGMEICRRLSVEAEVLEWAMEETEAALRPENQYGAR